MRTRLAAPWVALVLVLVALLAYSVGAQSVSFWPTNDVRLTVKAIPDGKDIRSFHAALVVSSPGASPAPVDIYTVPPGRVFVLTDVILGFQYLASGVPLPPYPSLRLRENGPAGLIRGSFMVRGLNSGNAVHGGTSYSLASGIPFQGSTTVTVDVDYASGSTGTSLPVTVSGYLADAF